MSDASEALFDRVVTASRLSKLVAPFTVSRLLIRAGVLTPRTMTPAQLLAALPTLERGLAVYLPPDELARAVDDLGSLVADSPAVDAHP